MLKFEQRHGREDNLMYRQSEGGRESINNEVEMTAIKQRLVTAGTSDYDFRRDFLKNKNKKEKSTMNLSNTASSEIQSLEQKIVMVPDYMQSH